ncbi:uncharacterized protein AMSG_11221 [Thecamonas trahens ATCC 50062]|uniref:Uncharacterized protein n=1 Tax=Thecamonas trahens ATCC 50062 TaxID=461836 RepID=A0A0L0DUB4_THETB|nr:hypothetical protein AMSG_11221 [Thecamonas trahens ATCC 50062]KNC55787.1 hypothetical protein AMSG_11221 [Thecamonas trahens ATCC 50062]|eukprot:XP_013752869.1 hypothetical protein AMSG_11221 [Thecamonas trahens ATCC 50062]
MELDGALGAALAHGWSVWTQGRTSCTACQLKQSDMVKAWLPGPVVVEDGEIKVPVASPALLCGLCQVLASLDKTVAVLAGDDVDEAKKLAAHFALVAGVPNADAETVAASGGNEMIATVARLQQAVDMAYAARTALHSCVRDGLLAPPVWTALDKNVADLNASDVLPALFGIRQAPSKHDNEPATKRAKRSSGKGKGKGKGSSKKGKSKKGKAKA